MNNLVLRGKLKVVDGLKYVSVHLNSKSYLLPIVVDDCPFSDGDSVCFRGRLTTRGVPKDGGGFKKIWAGNGKLFKNDREEYFNSFSCIGTLVKIFDIRITPLSCRKVVDFIVACGDNYYNCIAFDKVAERLLLLKGVGDKVLVDGGVFQSRDYVKDGSTMTAYEVLVKDFL